MQLTCGMRSSCTSLKHRPAVANTVTVVLPVRSPAPSYRPGQYTSQRSVCCDVGTGIDPGVIPGPPSTNPGTPGPSISPRQPGGDPTPGTVPDIDPGTPPSIDPKNVPGGVPDPGVSPGIDPGLPGLDPGSTPGIDPGVISPGDPSRL